MDIKLDDDEEDEEAIIQKRRKEREELLRVSELICYTCTQYGILDLHLV